MPENNQPTGEMKAIHEEQPQYKVTELEPGVDFAIPNDVIEDNIDKYTGGGIDLGLVCEIDMGDDRGVILCKTHEVDENGLPVFAAIELRNGVIARSDEGKLIGGRLEYDLGRGHQFFADSDSKKGKLSVQLENKSIILKTDEKGVRVVSALDTFSLVGHDPNQTDELRGQMDSLDLAREPLSSYDEFVKQQEELHLRQHEALVAEFTQENPEPIGAPIEVYRSWRGALKSFVAQRQREIEREAVRVIRRERADLVDQSNEYDRQQREMEALRQRRMAELNQQAPWDEFTQDVELNRHFEG